MDNRVTKFELSNGLEVVIHDATRRYYEDYHLVRLEIVCEAPILPGYFENSGLFTEARALLGDSAVYRRTLEKMGVPYHGIEDARAGLINGFESTTLPYFSVEDFPRRLVLSELTKARGKSGRRHC